MSLDSIAPSTVSAPDDWFEYPVQVYPHHTDYGGIVWHGTYLEWMEAARVDCLRSRGMEYADLVAQGVELQVFELALRYHRGVKMGASAIVRTRVASFQGVRMNWDYEIVSGDRQVLYVSAQVTLVPVDAQKGKIIRKIPLILQEIIAKL
jgi:acyl-CoA thioester hydrolase